MNKLLCAVIFLSAVGFSLGAETLVSQGGYIASLGNPENQSMQLLPVSENVMTVKKCIATADKYFDSITIRGTLDALPSDLHKADEIKVALDAEYLDTPLEWVFTIDEIDKGQYVNLLNREKISVNNRLIPRVSRFKFNTKDGIMCFAAKNVDLTGLSCPITVTVTIGEYIAQFEMNEKIVNGRNTPCPPQFIMGIADTVTVVKSRVGAGIIEGTDSMMISGFFTIAGEPNKIDPNKPLAVKIGEQTFTIGGSAFISNLTGNIKSCVDAVCIEDINWLCTARFNFAKCTYFIKLNNITVDKNGVVPFGIDVFGFDLGGPGSGAKVNTGY